MRRAELWCAEVGLGQEGSGRVWHGMAIFIKENMKKKEIVGGNSPTNEAKDIIETGFPYNVKIKLQGSCDILFHKWSNESVLEKSKSSKGSKSRKTDDLDSFVYRNEEGYLCIPGEYLRGAIIGAAKFKQDPRSSRKSAMDLYKAGIICLTHMASVGIKDWDYVDMRRVTIQRNSITRSRPALKAGWEAVFEIMVNLPEYISKSDLLDTITMAGKLIGLGDFRPTFGRFQVTKFG